MPEYCERYTSIEYFCILQSGKQMEYVIKPANLNAHNVCLLTVCTPSVQRKMIYCCHG